MINGYARAWKKRDARAAATLFADNTIYGSHPFRPVQKGRSAVLEYTVGAFDLDEVYEVRFGRPVVMGARAAVEYWGLMKEHGRDVTIAGCVMLRFARNGLCNELRDCWVLKEGRISPPNKLSSEDRIKKATAGSTDEGRARGVSTSG